MLNILDHADIKEVNFNRQKYFSYTVGALLYSPATNSTIADGILSHKFGSQYSLALCLEDSIGDKAVTLGENQIIETFCILDKYIKENNKQIDLPKIFIRVRTPEQAYSFFHRLESYVYLLTGFIFPKYSLYCSELYNDKIIQINKEAGKKLYMMPILESRDILNLNTRYHCLYELKSQLDDISEFVLNVRVGGNDFCKEFGIRRHYNQTIYDILAVSQVLSDIITVFLNDFVVSGPVFEYFSGQGDEWKKGLKKEIQHDLLNGFIGKTVIHPNQIPIVNECLKVSSHDYKDAITILNWEHETLEVEKSSSGERMNEIKTHQKWALKTILLGNIYGVFNNV